ncbi:hypothetical protein HOH45_03885 [bacterium]|nr:hypothetical protein [bacterium]
MKPTSFYLNFLFLFFFYLTPRLFATSPLPDHVFSFSSSGAFDETEQLNSIFLFPFSKPIFTHTLKRVSSLETVQDGFGYTSGKFSALHSLRDMSLGIGVYWASTSDIPIVSSEGSRPTITGYTGDSMKEFRATFTKQILDYLIFGMDVSYFKHDIYNKSGSSFTVGSGVNWVLSKDVALGLYATNLFSTGVMWESLTESVPLALYVKSQLRTSFATLNVATNFSNYTLNAHKKLHDVIEINTSFYLQNDGTTGQLRVGTLVSLETFKLTYSRNFLFLSTQTATQDLIGLILTY